MNTRWEILAKTADCCERLKKVVFDFACHENIAESYVSLYGKKHTKYTVEIV